MAVPLRVFGSQLGGANESPLPGRNVASPVAGVPLVSQVKQLPSGAIE